MVAGRLCERSSDVDAVVVLDAAGTLLEASTADGERGRELGELARELVRCADSSADEPVAQIEVQTGSGAVFAVRDHLHAIACVARRSALSSLVLYDLGHALAELREGRARPQRPGRGTAEDGRAEEGRAEEGRAEG